MMLGKVIWEDARRHCGLRSRKTGIGEPRQRMRATYLQANLMGL